MSDEAKPLCAADIDPERGICIPLTGAGVYRFARRAEATIKALEKAQAHIAKAALPPVAWLDCRIPNHGGDRAEVERLRERLDQFESYAITVDSALADRAEVERGLRFADAIRVAIEVAGCALFGVSDGPVEVVNRRADALEEVAISVGAEVETAQRNERRLREALRESDALVTAQDAMLRQSAEREEALTEEVERLREALEYVQTGLAIRSETWPAEYLERIAAALKEPKR